MKDLMKCRVMVLSPHADDAELGAGGYLARVVQSGGEVMVVLATIGDVRHLHSDQLVVADQRAAEFRAAMRELGVQHTRILTEGMDGSLNQFPRAQMVGVLDEVQQDFQPDVVLLPLPSAHQDHAYCWEVGVAMARPNFAKHQPALVAAYEYPLTGWGAGAEYSSFKGGLYVNVTATWERKLAALRQHRSQMRQGRGHLLSEEGAAALGRWRGMESGYEYAELLHVIRQRWD